MIKNTIGPLDVITKMLNPCNTNGFWYTGGGLFATLLIFFPLTYPVLLTLITLMMVILFNVVSYVTMVYPLLLWFLVADHINESAYNITKLVFKNIMINISIPDQSFIDWFAQLSLSTIGQADENFLSVCFKYIYMFAFYTMYANIIFFQFLHFFIFNVLPYVFALIVILAIVVRMVDSFVRMYEQTETALTDVLVIKEK